MAAVASLTSNQKKQYAPAEMVFLIRLSCLVAVVALLGVRVLMHSQSHGFITQVDYEKVMHVERFDSQQPQVNVPLNHGEHETVIYDENIDFPSIAPSAEAFVNENCEIGMDEWQGEEEWQRRAPAFLLVGAKKCGTTSLFQYLQQHPDIIQPRRKELLSFIPQRFRHWAHPGDFESKINVQAARKDMYAHDYRSETIKRRNMSISFEATPDYLLYSRFSAKAILCTVPWVKILVILRNPVDRVFSHYNYLTDVSRMSQLNFSMPKETFEEWILADMVRLAKHGVVDFRNTTDDFFGSQSEKDAWTKYQKIPNARMHDRPLARSLYAIQLEEWFDALRSIGRDPRSDVLIVLEEDLKVDAATVANKIFKWLGVPPYEISAQKKGMVTTYSSTLKPGTRQLLEDFYYPYNQRLYKLLGEDWQGIWDRNSEEKNFSHVAQIVAQGVAQGKKKDTPELLNSKQKSFLSKHCKLGSEKRWWIQEGDKNSWRRRAPYFLLIGAKKGGTTSIFIYLQQHPNIVPGDTERGGKELHSFQPDGGFPQWKNVTHVGNAVLVDVAREQLYQRFYLNPRIKSDPSVVSFDATPDYLLYSALSSKAILCTVPWVKLMVSLRNPIDRLFSNYNFIMDNSKMPEWFIRTRKNYTFEEFIEADVKQLTSFGVLQNEIPQEEFFGSEKEKTAWRRYQSTRNLGERSIARSLYALQVEEWFAWLEEADRDPSEILFVTEEELKENASGVMKRVVEWLGLPPHEINTTEKVMVTKYSSPAMNSTTRAKLQAFFDPYNKRFYKLMGPEWEGMWD
ncbi:[heparan sulfate]-glucosamine 3-sulfotransferase-like protein [Fragilaria crotonensis]|nr:[heparan sulfate]-glucosamine 3-sulfotransferase-like protein [Fragilaria crotonensis]